MILALPLLSAIVYVAAALLLKRGVELGADVLRTARLCNFTIALVFLPLLWLGGTFPGWHALWQPALAGVLFVSGQVFTLLALNVGDVSVATPVLGVKIPLVALLTTVLLGERIGIKLWVAALLSSIAIALLNFSRTPSPARVGRTILLALAAAASYALFDVLVQKWSPAWGAGRFLPVLMGFVAAVSLLLRPWHTRREIPDAAARAAYGKWVTAGAICLALQGAMFVLPVALYGQATMANVLYSSRGLWSVVAVWLVGHWVGNRERELGPRVFAWRFVGAALLMAAILSVVWAR